MKIVGNKVRVVRLLEYEGSKDWIEQTLLHSWVPLNGEQETPNGIVKSSLVEYKEICEN